MGDCCNTAKTEPSEIYPTQIDKVKEDEVNKLEEKGQENQKQIQESPQVQEPFELKNYKQLVFIEKHVQENSFFSDFTKCSDAMKGNGIAHGLALKPQKGRQKYLKVFCIAS